MRGKIAEEFRLDRSRLIVQCTSSSARQVVISMVHQSQADENRI
jgi:hypothetical protein